MCFVAGEPFEPRSDLCGPPACGAVRTPTEKVLRTVWESPETPALQEQKGNDNNLEKYSLLPEQYHIRKPTGLSLS